MSIRSASIETMVNTDALLLVLLAVSLAGNVYLGLRLRSSGVRDAPPPVVPVGTRLDRIEGVDDEGHRRVVEVAGAPAPTVLFVYSSDCPFCRMSWPMFQALAHDGQHRFRFVGLCLGSVPLRGVPEVVSLASPSPTTIQALQARSVPQTIVVSSAGRVENVWAGAYVGLTRQQVETFFGVAMPEFVDAPNVPGR